jgi:ubiquinone/menaquinone biosynthesis C-methylase UbiE
MSRLRRDLLAGASGDILEIGFGTGLNLEHYPEHVRRITAIDPGEGMSRIARRRIAGNLRSVDLRIQTAEALPFDDDTFDCVVSTWTLCSIPDVSRAIGEIARVLRPGGRFLFLEHGLAESTGVQRWQHRLTPLQRRLAGGCCLNLDIGGLVRSAPFGQVEIERFLMEGTPRLLGSMYRGLAVR